MARAFDAGLSEARQSTGFAMSNGTLYHAIREGARLTQTLRDTNSPLVTEVGASDEIEAMKSLMFTGDPSEIARTNAAAAGNQSPHPAHALGTLGRSTHETEVIRTQAGDDIAPPLGGRLDKSLNVERQSQSHIGDNG